MRFFKELAWYARFGWTHVCAALGNAKANYRLGSFYEKTNMDIKNIDKAVLFYMKAAQKGHVQAQRDLGRLYALGKGVERVPTNPRSGIKEWQNSAEYKLNVAMQRRNGSMESVVQMVKA